MPQVFARPEESEEPAADLYGDRAGADRRAVSFFQNGRPVRVQGCERCGGRRRSLRRSNAAVIAALKEYGAWMKTDLLPRSNGDYRLGAETFRKKLAYDEMVDIPLDRLLTIAYADLHKNQAEFARIAKELDATKTPQQVLAELATIHPAPDKLLPAFQNTFSIADRVYSRASHHHDSERCGADARRDAAVYAGDDAGLDGSSGAV